jgi:UDP-glucose 4-epimerase
MRFLLLGGIGYLGGRLAQFLKFRGHAVDVTSRRPVAAIPDWVRADRALQLDLADSEALVRAVEGVDVVFDLAAPDAESSGKDPAQALRFAAETTWRICDAICRQSNKPRLVYLSTFHVYGRGVSGTISEATPALAAHPYSLSKRVAEEVVQWFRRERNLLALNVRLSNAFGAPAGPEITQWSLVFNDLCRQASTQGKLTLKSTGLQKRNFITIGDAVRALEFLALRANLWPHDGVLNLGSDLHLSIREVAEIVAERSEKATGRKPEIEIPENAPAESVMDFTFSCERLASLGFHWKNEVEAEVDTTLSAIRAAG